MDIENQEKSVEERVTVINSKTEITYHQLYEFGKLFEANKINL